MQSLETALPQLCVGSSCRSVLCAIMWLLTDGLLCRVASDLYRVLDKCEVGDIVDVEVLRENAKEHLSVTLEASTN